MIKRFSQRSGAVLAALALLAGAGSLRAEPVIFFRAILNAASFMPPGAPGGSIAQGSIFTIFGRDIGPAQFAQVSEFPLGTTFQGVAIEITQGGVTVNGIPIFVSSGQVNAIMPSNAPLGRVSVRILFNGERSNPASLTVVENSVGVFTATGAGIGPGILQNFVSQTVQPLNTTAKTAKPGQVMTMWATGLGRIGAPDNQAPPVGTLPFDVEIFVGGKLVARTKVFYSGRAPCCSGVDQFVFEIPADAPLGCYVPVVVRVAGEAVSNTVTIAISADGERCSEPLNPFVEPFLSGGKVGAIDLLRIVLQLDVDVLDPARFTVDNASAYFHQETGGELAFNPLFALPPHGSCTSYATAGDLVRGVPFPYVTSPGLDAGEITVNGPAGAATLTRTAEGESTNYPETELGGPAGLGENRDKPLYLSPGDYQVRGAGGADIGAIEADVRVVAPPQWTNMDQLGEVDRNEGAVFEWTPSDSDWLVVLGMSVDKPGNASGMFLCVVPKGASSFRAPSEVLANLPAGRANIEHSTAFLLLGSFSGGVVSPFAADGLNFGAVLSRTAQVKSVRFR